MRFLVASTTASLLISGAALLGAAPAFAGADDGQTKAFWNNQVAPSATDRNGQYVATHRQYMQMDPRDAKATASASNSDGANPYFDHAEGTMSTHAGEAAQPSGSQSGQYVAAYHQYMQMDPRDAKVSADAAKNVDGSNIYFNHAKGTMSGN